MGSKSSREKHEPMSEVPTVLGVLKSMEGMYLRTPESEYKYMTYLLMNTIKHRAYYINATINSKNLVTYQGLPSNTAHIDKRFWNNVEDKEMLSHIKKRFEQDGITFDAGFENDKHWWTLSYYA